MVTERTFIVEGSRVSDIPSFYAEATRVFMPHEEWTLGPSLDALDDLLYGGIGELSGIDAPTVVLRDHVLLRDVLGVSTTRDYYLSKLDRPDVFDTARFRAALNELDAGTGMTYYDLVLGVFADHPGIRLVLG